MAAVKGYDAYIPGLNALLRDLRALDKDAQNQLRDASVNIATRYMVPAWQDAARNYAGPWGDKIAASVKARRDRIPAVNIGAARPKYERGATPTMVRYITEGGYTRQNDGKRAGTAAAFAGTGWMAKARTYISPAMREWANAVENVVADFNRGGVL